VSTNYLSNHAKYLLATGALNLATDTIKACLVLGTYTPDKDNDFADHFTAYELSTTNYTGGFGGSGRKTLTSQAVTEDTSNDLAKFTAVIPAWTALGPATAGPVTAYLALVKEVTDDAHSPIIATYDCVVTTNGGDLTVTANASGLITLT
jgi:hypothetical protein